MVRLLFLSGKVNVRTSRSVSVQSVKCIAYSDRMLLASLFTTTYPRRRKERAKMSASLVPTCIWPPVYLPRVVRAHALRLVCSVAGDPLAVSKIFT